MWIHDIAVVKRDSDARATMLHGVLRDITGERKAELAMETALSAAEEATKAKSDFLANMSHETVSYTHLDVYKRQHPVKPP